MLDLFIFLAGFLVLLRGQFRFMNRYVERSLGRRLGLILMLPSFFTMCAALMITSSIPVDETMTIEQYMNTVLGDPRLETLGVVEAIAIIVAIGFVIYLFLRIPPGVIPSTWNQPPRYPPGYPPYPPQSGQPPRSQYPPSNTYPFGGFPAAPPPTPAPSIMTTREAAVYLNITEDQVIQLIDDGKLPAAKGASGFRIAKSVLDEYKSSRPS